ncbi:hypothetical protein AAP_03332 [Ascosphaera apis ARSEF 7405]|uniref:DUF4336 domain-containing protein n=1 Tax=Ascosphaera apis ARSEF 7405 TaxID=392613 RepID=A0A167YQ88_9EURO|nr:hypothetical protein AAP_03332 [Ascosphaera apis ARSEF 7405]
MSKLTPANPDAVMVIRDVCESITTISLPFSRYGYVPIGGRATIVKLKTGSLAVFSPVAYTPSVETKLNELGNRVRYLIAPDVEHHLFIKAWKDLYPQAEVIGPHGLQEKWQYHPATKNEKVDYVFTPENKREMKIQPEFDEEFDYEYVNAHQNRELVFCHKPSRTLIEADLMFNLPAVEQYSKSPEDPAGSGAARLMNKAGCAASNCNNWQRRFLWYAGIRDHKSGKESIARISEWDFQRLIPCHGDVIEVAAKNVFLDVFKWFLP